MEEAKPTHSGFLCMGKQEEQSVQSGVLFPISLKGKLRIKNESVELHSARILPSVILDAVQVPSG